MSGLREFDLLFLDAGRVSLAATKHEPTDEVPVIDFDLETEGDPRSCATLGYWFDEKKWVAMIWQSATDEGMFDRSAEATDEQKRILVSALPQERRDHVAALEARFTEHGCFGPTPGDTAPPRTGRCP